ncbi:hypothetical protein ACFVFF_37025 [Streptomyces sp. NPDC057680]|uniref:hypothetical protein n=1 Tax=Streptomyces sp. NPDC057680 TaxID=3346208 RepID=UPI0036A90AB3
MPEHAPAPDTDTDPTEDRPFTLRLVQPPLEVEGGVLGGSEFEATFPTYEALARALGDTTVRATLENMQHLFSQNLRSLVTSVNEPSLLISAADLSHGFTVPSELGKSELLTLLAQEVTAAGEDPEEFIAMATRAELKRRAMERWIDEQDEEDKPITEEEIQAARARYRRA